MRKMMMFAAATAMVTAAPAFAQDAAPAQGAAPMQDAAPTPEAAPMAGAMTPEQVGAGLMMGTPAASYAARAADSDMYEIQSSKIALSKSKSEATKAFAQEMIADHMTTTKALMAALPNTEPKVPKPPKKLSVPTADKIAALKAASPEEFDGLYMSQQAEAHRGAWSLHKGYAQDGTDPALKQVATSAVPIIEKHLAHAKAAPGATPAM